MWGRAALIGFVIFLAGLGLGIWGSIRESLPMILAFYAVMLGGITLMLVCLVKVAGKGTKDYLSVAKNRTIYLEAAAGEQTFAADVLSIRNTGTLLGGQLHSTEIRIEVLRDDELVRGVVKEFLTPAQIASSAPGTTIRVKPVPRWGGQYILDPNPSTPEMWENGLRRDM